MRVVAEGLKPEETDLSKVMTRNPALVAGDTLAMEALAKMVEALAFSFAHMTSAVLLLECWFVLGFFEEGGS
jgi:CBS domain-containing protein